MKLHATSTQQYQTVTGYDEAWIEINAIRFDHSFFVLPEVAPVRWMVSDFNALQAEDFGQITKFSPDLLILGTGSRQRFPLPRLIADMIAQRIGVECMDNQAACRTYNILMAEGRKVALAIILPQQQTMSHGD